MAVDKKQKPPNSIPIRFVDSDDPTVFDADEEINTDFPGEGELEQRAGADPANQREPEADSRGESFGGPELAELIASRAELKRLQTALAEAQDALTRRQADFENYRKRIERERGEAHN